MKPPMIYRANGSSVFHLSCSGVTGRRAYSAAAVVVPSSHAFIVSLTSLCAPSSLTQLLTHTLERKGETASLGRGQIDLPHWWGGRADARKIRREGSREGRSCGVGRMAARSRHLWA